MVWSARCVAGQVAEEILCDGYLNGAVWGRLVAVLALFWPERLNNWPNLAKRRHRTSPKKAYLGGAWGHFRGSWKHLGDSWGHLGRLGAVLGPS